MDDDIPRSWLANNRLSKKGIYRWNLPGCSKGVRCCEEVVWDIAGMPSSDSNQILYLAGLVNFVVVARRLEFTCAQNYEKMEKIRFFHLRTVLSSQIRHEACLLPHPVESKGAAFNSPWKTTNREQFWTAVLGSISVIQEEEEAPASSLQHPELSSSRVESGTPLTTR